MFGVGAATRIYLAPGSTDMRKGANGLYGLVRDQLQCDPLSGHLFLFSGSIAVFVGEEGGGRCRSVEKSLYVFFPPRLEIPQVQQDFHFLPPPLPRRGVTF